MLDLHTPAHPRHPSAVAVSRHDPDCLTYLADVVLPSPSLVADRVDIHAITSTVTALAVNNDLSTAHLGSVMSFLKGGRQSSINKTLIE
jgi:hypothetical protein